jgi:hypothetical protein
MDLGKMTGTEREGNELALLLPAGEAGEYPCIKVGGAEVSAGHQGGALVVSIVLDQDRVVPVLVKLQGEEVYALRDAGTGRKADAGRHRRPAG